MKATRILGLIALDIVFFISIVGLCFLFGLNSPTKGSHRPSAGTDGISQKESIDTPGALLHKTKTKNANQHRRTLSTVTSCPLVVSQTGTIVTREGKESRPGHTVTGAGGPPNNVRTTILSPPNQRRVLEPGRLQDRHRYNSSCNGRRRRRDGTH